MLADPEANQAAEHHAQDRGEQHQPDTQVLRRSRIDRGCDQDCFAGERQADRFQEDENENDPGAVMMDQLRHSGLMVRSMVAAVPCMSF